MHFDRSTAVFLLSGLAACGDGGGPSTGSTDTATLHVVVTDAPFDHVIVREARVWIDRVTAHTQADAREGFVTLYEGEPLEVDLLVLENGLVQTLATAPVPPGEYRQVRLHVSRAALALANGTRYTTEACTIGLAGTGTNGFPVHVDPPFALASGESRTLLLDVDLGKSFVPDEAGDPMHASVFRLQPVVRAADPEASGELRGVVRRGDGEGGFVPVADATVYLLPPGATDVASSISSTSTSKDGGYAVLGVPPGMVDVLATLEALSGRVDGERVTVGSVTLVDLVVE